MPIPFPDFHPRVNTVAQAQYNSGFYSDALFRASRELENECKNILKEKTGRTLSGQELMAKLFSIDKNWNTIFPLVNLSLEEGADRQKSLYFLYSGFTGIIRNPLAHDWDLADIEALYGLNIVSYLFYKLDRAKELNKIDVISIKQEKWSNPFEEKLSEALEKHIFQSLASRLISDTRIKNLPSQTQDIINARLELTKLTEDILIHSIDEIGELAYNTYSVDPWNKLLIDHLINQLYDSKL